MLGLQGRASRAVVPLLPVIAVFFTALLVLANIIEQRTQFQIEIAETSAGHDLTTIVDFARSQSAAFASTSFIGYSIGRYYGFAPAYAQISPDPDRAAALLRSYYGKGQTPPQEMPPSLPAYASVHDRFHASFQGLIASTLFDDLYLIDHFGRVVYSLQKDSNFAADLTQPRSRDQPLAEVYREVMARLQQTEDPSKILVVSGIKRIEDTYGVLLARPVIQHGSVEGIVAFRLPARARSPNGWRHCSARACASCCWIPRARRCRRPRSPIRCARRDLRPVHPARNRLALSDSGRSLGARTAGCGSGSSCCACWAPAASAARSI